MYAEVMCIKLCIMVHNYRASTVMNENLPNHFVFKKSAVTKIYSIKFTKKNIPHKSNFLMKLINSLSESVVQAMKRLQKIPFLAHFCYDLPCTIQLNKIA